MVKRVAVIGGGVVGLTTAWYCQQAGMDVTVIDRNPDRRDGCSFGNAGMLVPSHVVPLAAPGMVKLGLKWMFNPRSPFYIRPRLSSDLLAWLWQFNRKCNRKHVSIAAPVLRDLHLKSRQLYLDLEQQIGEGFGLKTRGLLMLCKSQRGLDEEAEAAEYANELGVPAEVLDAAETARRDPGIEMDVAGSVLYTKDCHLSPNRLMDELQSQLESGGCQFVWETTCNTFSSAGSKLTAASTTTGNIEADEYVLCGGVWSMELAQQLNLKLPMQAGKGYSVTLEQPTQLPDLCSLLHEARVAVTPIGNALRVGGTMELSGVDESISKSRVEGIVNSIPKYFPRFRAEDFQGLKPWSGLRPCSPDGLPFIGRSKRWSNLTVNTGHAMMGISLAPVSGQLVSRTLTDEDWALSGAKALSPDRFR